MATKTGSEPAVAESEKAVSATAGTGAAVDRVAKKERREGVCVLVDIVHGSL